MRKKIVAIIGFPSKKAMVKWAENQDNMDDLYQKYPNSEAELDHIENQIVVRSDEQERDEK